MVDIHHHLLSGLDDGAKDFETSVEMARQAANEGITHVVCTPHANSIYDFSPALNRIKRDELQAAISAAGIPLTLGLGSDFHLSFDNIESALKDHTPYSINGTGYLLVELPDFGLPKGLTQIYYELRLAGATPILTHPERNQTLQSDYARMEGWLRGGLLVQVTADSVLGKMGKRAQQIAHKFLENRWVHFLATDAHSLRGRPPRMKEAYALVANKYGQNYADLICTHNPTSVYNGEPMPQQEEPLHLYDDGERTKSSWWGRFFGS